MAGYSLDYHPGAVDDFFALSIFIESYAGISVARRKLAEIEAATYRLEDFPKIGSLRHDILPNLRAIPAAEKAVICFTVDDKAKTVRIICISYGGADWTERVRERGDG